MVYKGSDVAHFLWGLRIQVRAGPEEQVHSFRDLEMVPIWDRKNAHIRNGVDWDVVDSESQRKCAILAAEFVGPN